MKQWVRWVGLLVLLVAMVALTPFGLALFYQVQGGMQLEKLGLYKDGIECQPEAKLTNDVRLQVQDSIASFQAALQYNPYLGQAYFLLGRSYCWLGEPESAIQAYQKYTQLRPSNPVGYLELGFAYQAYGDQKLAAAAWQAAGLSAQDFIDVGYSLANIQQFESAVVWYDRALFVQPGLADAWYALGLAYQRQAQWQAAIEAYSAALEASVWQSIRVGDVYYRLGQVYQSAGEYQDIEKALAMYAAALDSDAFSLETVRADVYYKRGELFTWLGRSPEECIAQFRQALLLDPGHFWAHLRLGQALYQASGEVEPAAFEVRQAIDDWPAAQNRVLPYQILGDIYRDAGMMAEAVAAYEDALQIDPQAEAVLQRLEELGEK